METNEQIKIEPEGTSFAPRRPKKRKTCCAVQNCRSRSDKDLDLSFHTFPRKQCKLLEAWKTATGIETVQYHTTLCSRHFTKDNYFFPDAPSKRHVLKKTAVPSCNLPGTWDETEDSQCGTQTTSAPKETVFGEEQTLEIKQEAVDCYDEIVSCEDTLDKANGTEFVKVETCEESVADMETLVKSEDLTPRFFDFLKSDGQLSTATGIESFEILRCIVDLATTTTTTTTSVNENASDMSLHDKIIMTYVKLKQNLSYSFLAIMFNCTANHCAQVFEDTLRLLSSSLKFAIPWPSREEISRNLPICFRNFKNVRVVLDCKTLFVYKKCCCETAMYTRYCKHSESLKIMTAATPAGNIAFVGKPYSARASDEVIFKNSEIVNMLEAGDDVVVDRGFLIDDICEANNWKCIRPPVLQGNKRQFSKEETVLAANIAKARMHVDRSHDKIKQFKIVADVLTNDLVPLVEEIVTVICGTVNLSSPIMKDYKFITCAQST